MQDRDRPIFSISLSNLSFIVYENVSGGIRSVSATHLVHHSSRSLTCPRSPFVFVITIHTKIMCNDGGWSKRFWLCPFLFKTSIAVRVARCCDIMSEGLK